MKPIVLAALSLALTAPVAAQRPVETQRTDRHGVTWLYGERTDPMEDRRQIVFSANWRRSTIGLMCVEGRGMQLRIRIAGWHFLPRVEATVRARVDQAPAFDTAFSGIDGATAEVRTDQAGRDLAQGLLAGRERIILRHEDGSTVTLRLSMPRPEAERFRQRCREIAPPAAPHDASAEQPRITGAPAGEARSVAAEAIRPHGTTACPRITAAERVPDGSIRATCSNGEAFRVFTAGERVVAMRCSAAAELGVGGC